MSRILDRMVSSQAWDVPNSRLVVNLKKLRRFPWEDGYVEHPFDYIAGVSLKLSQGGSAIGYSLFNETGFDPYGAFEALMTKIDRAAELVFKVVDLCAHPEALEFSDERVEEPCLSRRSAEAHDRFFAALSKAVRSGGKEVGIRIMRVRESDGCSVHYGVVAMDGQDLFVGNPSFGKKDVAEDVRMAALGAAAMLEKFQGMAWNVMIDSGDSDYDVVANGNSTTLMKKKEA